MVVDERIVAVAYSVEGNGPDVGLTVAFAERCRLALMSQFGRVRQRSLKHAGRKDSGGRPLQVTVTHTCRAMPTAWTHERVCVDGVRAEERRQRFA